MSIPLPKLDNQDFDRLVSQGRSLIPRYAPAWTDHNVHDPGITLMELLAWLVEMDSYRLERISQPTYRTFLRLVGIEPRPLHPAGATLVLNMKAAGQVLSLPAGLQIGDGQAGVTFQTTGGINISPAGLKTVLGGPEEALVDCSEENEDRKPYFPFGADPGPGYALYLGFDRQFGAVSKRINLYVWAGSAEADGKIRTRLISEQEAAILEASEDAELGLTRHVPDWREHYSARTVWEYYAGSGRWLPLAGVVDETRGLTLSGPVSFMAPNPADHQPDGLKNGATTGRYLIRCRLKSGAYELPPQISHIALNTVGAKHAADFTEPEAFTSTGRAGQIFQLRQRPVVPGSANMEVVHDGKKDGKWKEALYWDGVGPHDRVYVLRPETGEILFGDGRHGRVPPAGASIAVTCKIGGGAAGNVDAGRLTQVLDNEHNKALVPNWDAVKDHLSDTQPVAQPFPAFGGSDAESLPEAKARAVELLGSVKRAVTLGDFEALALAVPGVPVARALAIPDYDPRLPHLPAPGSLTMVIVPDGPGSRPAPGPDMLRAVACYLERRRLVTTEVHVTAPLYTAVQVNARLTVGPRVDEAKMADQAKEALDTFFHPLHGGADGKGRPVGRDVYRSEIMALLNGLAGVLFVDRVTLRRGDGQGAKAAPPQEEEQAARCGNIAICRHALVVSGQHQITVRKESGLS